MAFSDDVFDVCMYIEVSRRNHSFKKSRSKAFQVEQRKMKFAIVSLRTRGELKDGWENTVDTDQIMNHLALFDLIKFTKSKEGDYLVEVLSNFQPFYEKQLSLRDNKIENLSYVNLLRLYDVALDIKEQLEFMGHDEVTIWCIPPSVRFPELLTSKNDLAKTQYSEARVTSLRYLEALGAIDHIKYPKSEKVDDDYVKVREDARFEIELDRMYFMKTFEQIENRIREISPTNDSKLSSEQSNKISFDSASHSLSIGNYTITFHKDDSNQSELCRVLLQDQKSINKCWNRDEILEEWGWTEDKIYNNEGKLLSANRLKVYQSAEKVNAKITKATKGKIIDFLTYSTKTVSVNKKYRNLLANN